ncbi:MAG: hypothetical protein NDI61_00500 [Bdellovibrionaceae bacterium]|nr:hypothetical protein [Pseudobdellovibrionaceae bacterium]
MKVGMKTVLCTLAAALVSGHASASTEKLAQAEAAYQAREYDAAGKAQAQTAAQLYGELAAEQTTAVARAKYLSAQSEALYFLGHASDDKALKIQHHLAGLAAGEKAVAEFGITDVTQANVALLKSQFQADDLKVLAEALYQRGANLGQWGQANGVTESLGRWPDLKATMQLIIDLGFSSIQDYGPLRTLGRGNHQIPALLGGSNKRAEKYLQSAVSKTKAPGTIYSVNGYNNTFYAELLRDIEKADEGRALLESFVRADAAQLNPRMAPETRRAQREALDLLNNW